MRNFTRISIAVAALFMASAAMAQKPAVYPAKGQSSQQQGRDDGECWPGDVVAPGVGNSV